MPREPAQPDEAVLERPDSRTQRPTLYHVVLLNDDYTTMAFVVRILEEVFMKGPAEAHGLMMRIHTEGKAACGTYTYEVAETKVGKVHDLARSEGFPLRCTLEQA